MARAGLLIWAGLLLPLAATAAPAQAAGRTAVLDRVLAPSTVSAFRGWLAYTRFDPAARTFQLVVRTPRGVVRPLTVPPSRRAPQFDLGIDAKGRLALVYTACAAGRGSCDLRLVTVPDGISSAIRNASTAGADELAPTLWRGRIAFVRAAPGEDPVVLTRRLDWPADRRAQRLPGVPLRQDFGPGAGPQRTRHRSVSELALGPRGLVENVGFDDPAAGTCGEEQVRFVALPSTSVRVLRSVVCGLGGQTVVGVSQSGAWASWLIFCEADPGGCLGRSGGAFRSDLGSGRYEQLETPNITSYPGYALDFPRAYAVEAFSSEGSCRPQAAQDPGCPVVALDSGGWHRIRPPASGR